MASDSDFTITGRIAGDPENGGNRNNHAAISFSPAKQRAGISVGMGAALQHATESGTSIIVSTGIKAKASANLGVSADRAERQHDTRYDTPLRPNALGVVEARSIFDEAIRKSGGDLRKYTVGDIEDLLKKHPNVTRPEVTDRFSRDMQILDGMNTSHLSQVVSGNLQDINGQLRDRTGITLGNIPTIPNYSLGDALRPIQLSTLNDVATRAQQAIANAGGAEQIGQRVASAIADAPLPSSVARAIPQDIAGRVASAVTDASNIADVATRHYQHIPTAQKVRDVAEKINKMVKYDPETAASAFAAVGANSPALSAAAVAEKAVSMNVKNIDWIAGKGIGIHPASITTLRLEAGRGDNNLGFSADTAEKLNLKIKGGSSVAAGAYAFVEQERVHWHGMDGSRKTNTLGLGGNVSKSMGAGSVGTLGVEAYTSQIHSVTPGNIPGKTKDNGVAVKGGITF
jgi:hypothetical protein